MAFNLNRCLNTINGLRAQYMDHEKPFQVFLDFQPVHRGVTRVVSGGNLAQNRKKWQFFVILPMAINLSRYLNTINGLRAQDMDRDKPFQMFSDYQPAHQGVTGVISGGNLAQNRKK